MKKFLYAKGAPTGEIKYSVTITKKIITRENTRDTHTREELHYLRDQFCRYDIDSTIQRTRDNLEISRMSQQKLDKYFAKQTGKSLMK